MRHIRLRVIDLIIGSTRVLLGDLARFHTSEQLGNVSLHTVISHLQIIAKAALHFLQRCAVQRACP